MVVDSNGICKAASIIKNGGLVAFPTETVYGLGADALNSSAVAKIFAAKERPEFDPLIVHIHNKQQMYMLTESIHDKAHMLIDQLWPGPLTIVVPKKQIVPDLVTAGLPNVGIRMPNNPVALALIKESGTPIAAPSANKFGSVSPTCAEHVRSQLGNDIDFIIDGGSCSVGIESTIISFTSEIPMLLRPGGIPIETIEKIVGPLAIPDSRSLTNASPGRALRHYATSAPVILDVSPVQFEGLRKGLLSLYPPMPEIAAHYAAVEILSPTGNLNEAACNLFAALRRLDNSNIDIIISATVPDHGLGLAINDRLKRAAQPQKL
jgi:L-threonylcarbamoyladenylate synthase